jgi:hypothetical protein
MGLFLIKNNKQPIGVIMHSEEIAKIIYTYRSNPSLYNDVIEATHEIIEAVADSVIVFFCDVQGSLDEGISDVDYTNLTAKHHTEKLTAVHTSADPTQLHADISAITRFILDEFSKRAVQVADKLIENHSQKQ